MKRDCAMTGFQASEQTRFHYKGESRKRGHLSENIYYRKNATVLTLSILMSSLFAPRDSILSVVIVKPARHWSMP